jgi:hypothetical protein
MRVSEWIVVAYFAYLAAAAIVTSIAAAQRVRILAAAGGIAGLVLFLADAEQTDIVAFARDWLPAGYILAAYYVTGWFVTAHRVGQERWLATWDARMPRVSWLARVPRPLRNFLEIAYTGCALLMPAGYAVLLVVGLGHLADRYWTTVVAAEFLSFASLPWFQTRPPWIVDRADRSPDSPMHGASLMWVKRTSVCMNTFPSGHAAGSLAVALAVIPFVPVAGAVLGALSLSIAAASIAGRYHYTIDAVAGLALGGMVSVIVSSAWP